MRHLVLMVHFDAQAVRARYQAALAPAGNVDLAFVWAGAMSSAYQGLGERLRDGQGRVLPRLVAQYAPRKPEAYESVSLVTFSAGYALAREMLKSPADREQLAALVMLDSLHAAFDPDGTASDAQLAPFAAYAQRAQQGRALFWLGHSDVRTSGYASTTQAARELVRLAGPLSGNFHVRGFDVRKGDRDEHIAAQTEWGPGFVGEALAPYLGSGDAAPTPVPPPPPKPAAHEVPKVQTPLSELDLARALRGGHRLAFGEDPSDARLACAWGQCALEHGRGKATYNNNIGNVSAFGKYAGPYYVIPCPERVSRDPDVWKTIAMKFRAHESPELGAADYWRLLAGRYASSLRYFDKGDAIAAAWDLSRLNYYTARAEHYAPAMSSLTKHALAVVLPALKAEPAPEPKAPEPDAYLSPERAGELLDLSRAAMMGGGFPEELKSAEELLALALDPRARELG